MFEYPLKKLSLSLFLLSLFPLSLSLSLLTPSFLSIWKSFWEEKVFVCEKDGKRVGHLNSFFHYFSSATYFGLELPPIFLTSPPCRPFRKKNTREGPSKWNCWQRFLLARLMRNFWRKLFSLWSLLLLQQQHKKATTLNLSRIRDYFHRSKGKKTTTKVLVFYSINQKLAVRKKK